MSHALSVWLLGRSLAFSGLMSSSVNEPLSLWTCKGPLCLGARMVPSPHHLSFMLGGGAEQRHSDLGPWTPTLEAWEYPQMGVPQVGAK